MHTIIFILFIIINSFASAQNYGNWYEIDSMNIARVEHAMVVLPNGDVLVSGNDADSIQSSAEIYEFSTGNWRYTTPMNVPRAQHTLIVLNTGKVLAIGGFYQKSCELFDPQSESWSLTDSMIVARNWLGFTTTTLQDGRILVAGGLTQDTLGAPLEILASCEIYNPITEKWTIAPPMNVGRYNHTATLLSDGRVLVTGGETNNLTTDQCEIYNPNTNSWELTGNLQEKRSAHAAILLRNGNVFVSGGSNENPKSCEIFDTTLNQWSFVDNMLMSRDHHKIYYLTDPDKLLIVGDGAVSSGEETWEVYNPNLLKPDYVEAFPIKQVIRSNNIQLSNGNIFLAGGMEYLYTPMPFIYPSYRCWIFDITTDVNEKKLLLTNYKLSQNYPNPFNSQTSIEYELPSDATVQLVVYNILGEEVETLINQEQSAGSYKISFNAENLSSGIYYYSLTLIEPEESNGITFQQTKKMILLR